MGYLKNNFKKSNNTRVLSIISLIVALLTLSLGFAAFSATLTISSNVGVKPDSSTFSVKFSTEKDRLNESNVSPSYDQDSGIFASSGMIDNSGNPTLKNLQADFTKPGQFVTYKFYVRNEGEYTAYLNNVNFIGEKVCRGNTGTTDSLVEAACDSIKISVTVGEVIYSSTTGVNNHPLASNVGEEVIVRLEYSAGDAYVDGDFSITFSNVALVYSTIDDSSIKPVIPETKLVKLESGTLDTPGSIVSIGNERFYVIGQENEIVKLFSIYNLHVGNIVEGQDDSGNYIIAPLENPTGIQDSSAKGLVFGENSTRLFPWIGTTEFSTVTVYSGSIIESYVNNYKRYLEGLGANILAARLIIRKELEGFGCSGASNCKSAPSWIWSSSYWTGTDAGGSGLPPSGNIWFVNSNGAYGQLSGKNNNYSFGVRPVIEISKTEFE